MIVAVCGLHGGAGTTTIALTLAHGAALQAPAHVLLCETSPTSGDLALAAGLASPLGLAALARHVDAGRRPSQPPWLDAHGGKLRLLATPPGRAAPATSQSVQQVLRDADAAHELVVIDAGTISSSHAAAALRCAAQVIWTVDSTASPHACAARLTGDLAAPARDARWILAANATGKSAPVQLDAIASSAGSAIAAMVQVPALGTIGVDAPTRELAALQLVDALR